jgi:L-ascorbate peroxidase
VAVWRTGGPVIDVPLGRPDADQPSPSGRPLLEEMSLDRLRAHFAALGFDVRELVALSGGHTLGRVRGVPFTDDLFHFSNSYFRLLLGPDAAARRHLLASDVGLALDPEARVWVETYATDQDAFFRDFAAGYRKLTLLGTPLAAEDRRG